MEDINPFEAANVTRTARHIYIVYDGGSYAKLDQCLISEIVATKLNQMDRDGIIQKKIEETLEKTVLDTISARAPVETAAELTVYPTNWWGCVRRTWFRWHPA